MRSDQWDAPPFLFNQPYKPFEIDGVVYQRSLRHWRWGSDTRPGRIGDLCMIQFIDDFARVTYMYVTLLEDDRGARWLCARD